MLTYAQAKVKLIDLMPITEPTRLGQENKARLDSSPSGFSPGVLISL